MSGHSPARREASPRPAAVLGGFILFVAMGGLYSMYGPVLPTLVDRFSLASGDEALVLTAHFLGSLTGILAWMALAPRLGSRRGLVAGSVAMGVGALGFALAPAFWPSLISAWAIGLGFGALLVGLTTVFASGSGRRGAALLNLLAATFGAGAILGPLAVSAVGGSRFAIPYATGAVLAAIGVPLIASAPHVAAPEGSVLRGARRVPIFVWAFVALYVCYVGVESGIGGFEATHLLWIGTGASAAEGWAAGFWGAVTVGRVLAAPLALRMEPSRLVAGALALTAPCLVVAQVDALAPLAYVAAGLALAPVFPTGLAWLASRVPPGDTSSPSLVIAGAQLGGVVFAAAVGLLVGATSAAAIPGSLLIITLACLTLALSLRYRDREPRTESVPADVETSTASAVE